ncbi:hypothetical protein [Paludisphaera soli]|uniref:hypothetical protein n=1 Tax=Paludisphaera soli TaxID=2712865 RepID=UPI0013EBE192|nr:hypothetical protein [Paludisphaera soli]
MIRVRIPSSQVGSQFPADTPLKVLTAEEFDGLLRTIEARGRDRERGGPRLVRARHHARFSPGVLVGRSELVSASPPGPSTVSIEPWSPAILKGPESAATVAASTVGKTLLRLEPATDPAVPGETTTVLEWELRARPDSRGRIFALSLPGDETTSLTLDVPEGWEPSGAAARREGPSPGDGPGRETWRFHGRVGGLDLRLTNLAEARASGNPARIWVGGPTRIDLNAAERLATRPVNWTTDWTYQADEPGDGSFAVELDPGLELLSVEGPDVREFRAEPGAPGKVVVTMTATGHQASSVRFRGHARVPAEGPWIVPGIRPLAPLSWTGGSTTVVLDERHVVRECREREGRRVPPPPGEAANAAATVLVFDSSSPGPVAELTFRPAGVEPIYGVRGRIALRPSSIRFECEVSGLGLPGSVPEHELAISPGWAVDRVELAGVEEAVPWSRTVLPDGSTRLRVLAPASDAAPGGRTLVVGAVAPAAEAEADAPARLMLPRLRPTRGRIAEEVWVASIEGGVQLQPGAVKGIAWIDAAQAPGLLPPASPATADLRPVLAWRWTADDAEAPVEVRRADPSPRGWVQLKARLEDDGRRVAVSGSITIAGAGAGASAVRAWIGEPAGGLSAWTFTDAATGARLAPTILAEPDRRRLGFPAGGVALELTAEPSLRGRAAVRFSAALPWDGRGTIPLPCLAGVDAPRGVVVIETPEKVRTRIDGEGLSRIEPSLAEALAPGPEASAPVPAGAGWNTQALTYSSASCRLDLATEPLTPAPTPGLIREARLKTRAFRDGRSANRLWMLVAADQTQALSFRQPAGAVLASARVDGRAVDPIRSGGRMTIPLPPGTGDGTRAVVLDYRIESAGPPGDGLLRPAAPEIDLPCLSFSWDLSLPPGELFGEAGPGFVVDAAEPRPVWPFGALGVSRWRWPGERPATRAPREDALRRLDDLLGESPGEDLTLAEAFMRWDASPEPLLVDRSALAAEGMGPRSRFAPIPPDPGRAAVSLSGLQARGLTLVVVDDALVVTSRRAAGSPSGPPTWRSAVAEAVLWGSDATDRFQSAARWRGEPTAAESSSVVPIDGRDRAPGWSTWRLTASAWPPADAWVSTADAGTRALTGWAAALVVLAVGLRRAVSPRRGLIAPLLLMIASVALHDWWAAVPAPLTAGVFVGAFVTLLIRLGRLLRSTFRERRGATGPSRRGGTALLRRRGFRAAAWALAAAGLSRASADPAPGEVAPIVALLPYDGEFDPAAAPSLVILRQADHERLRGWSEAPPPPAEERAAIVMAEHRIARAAEPDLTVESTYTVRVDDGPATAFEFPVGGARDLAATLAEDPVPVIVKPGGEVAAVVLPGGRTSRLRIRRSVTPDRDGSLDTIDLKINRSPSARLTLDQPPGARPVQQLAARGRVVAKGDQTIEAVLGPVDRIGVSWTSAEPEVGQPSATVESLMLWDLDPAGERVRARLTYRTRRRTSTIRIALEPGLVPRSVQIPGLVDASWAGTDQNPEWIARVDPPLPDRTTVFLDFWRPLRTDAAAGIEGPTARRFPRLEPLGVDREAGLLAVRRPGHWTGRLEPPRDAEPVGDESFVRSWGALPDDVLTFAGTVRFKPQDVVEFRTGPTPTRWRRRPAVQLQIEAGRVDCRYEVEMSEISGLLDRAELALPAELLVLDVESPGMTDWSRPPGEPLRVRFDRIDLKSRRTITVRGRIPVSQLGPGPGPRQHRIRLPWVDPSEGRDAAGTLEVLSRGGVDLPTTPGGATLVSSEPSDSGDSRIRQTYRIDDPGRVGELRWAPRPPRTNVVVGSQATIHPDSAEWVAVLRYEVAGGPLDAIHLKVPAAWAGDDARIRLAGRDHQLTTESRDGWTFWTITPDRPIWGSQRLVLRSRSPIASGQEMAFPQVVPLGQGLVDTSIALVFATESVPTTAGSAGLRQISYAGRFQDEEFGGATGLAARAYHVEVESDKWSLVVQAPPGEDVGADADGSFARVRDADVACVLAADGSMLGSASYRTEPRSGQFLIIAPPGRGRLLRAAVDGAAVTPLLDRESRWTVPLGDQTARVVSLTWAVDRPAAGAGGGALALDLPRVGDGRTPTLLSVHVPAEATLKASSVGLTPIAPERLQLDRADRAARRAFDLIAAMDRGSGRDRGLLVSLLIEHESALRGAERVLAAASKGADRARRDRAARDLEVVKASRLQVVEALRSTGLDEPVAAAWSYLGLRGKGPDVAPSGAGVPEQVDRERVRRLGRPAYFAGPAPGLTDPPMRLEVEGDRAPEYVAVSEGRARSLLLLALLMGLGLAGLTSAGQAGAQSLIAAATLSLAAVAGGPLALSAGAAALAWGWLTRGPAPREAGSGF